MVPLPPSTSTSRSTSPSGTSTQTAPLPPDEAAQSPSQGAPATPRPYVMTYMDKLNQARGHMVNGIPLTLQRYTSRASRIVEIDDSINDLMMP